MKGTYRKHRPASTKTKGGNPSYYKPEHSKPSPCVNMKGEVIADANKYTAKNGKMYKRRIMGAHYVRQMSKQVIKKMDDQIVYGTVSILETDGGKQFWVARQEMEEWDAEQCIEVTLLVGESMTVEALNNVAGCWMEVDHVEICDTVKPTKDAAINRLGGVLA